MGSPLVIFFVFHLSVFFAGADLKGMTRRIREKTWVPTQSCERAAAAANISSPPPPMYTQSIAGRRADFQGESMPTIYAMAANPNRRSHRGAAHCIPALSPGRVAEADERPDIKHVWAMPDCRASRPSAVEAED